MRLPIPQLQRRGPQVAAAGPQTSGVPAFGLADLGAAMFNVGANAQHAANVEAEQAAREAQQRAARIEHEQRKARVIERIRDDRLKWLDEMQRRKTEAPEGADGFTPKALADFDTYRKKAVEQIPDEEERGMYDGLLGDLREHVGQTALVFQSDSRARYRARVIAEGADKSARLVAADPAQLPQVLAQELALIKGADGLAADAKAELAERTRDTLAWSAAQTIVDRDPDGFLARAGMTGGKTGKDGKVKPSDPAKALAAVQSDPILSNLPPQRLQQAVERATALSIERKERAQRAAEVATAKAESAAEAMVISALAANGGSWAELHPSLLSAVRPQSLPALMGFASRIARGADRVSDPALYLELTDTATLRSLSNDEFLRLRPKLSQQDWESFAKQRAAVGAQGQGELNSEAINTVLRNRMLSLGIDSTPKPGSTDAHRVAAIQRYVRESLSAAQQRAGKKFDDTETERYIDGLFAKDVTFRNTFMGIDRGTSSQRLLSMKPSDIPDDVRRALQADFRSRGIEPTEADLLGAYWALRDARR